MKPIQLTIENGESKVLTSLAGYWDHALLMDLLDDLPDSDRQIVVIPGAYQGDCVPEINKYIARFLKVLVFVVSDEEGNFDVSKLEHPDMKIYRQYGYYKNIFPIGYTTETRKHLKEIGVVQKDIDIFFAGQLNSRERKDMFLEVAKKPRTVLAGTDGFSRGFTPAQYYEYLAHAKTAPSPGGHVSPDSFRFYEALEAGCKPTHYPSYMNTLFPDMPYQDDSNEQFFAWWIRKKVQLKQQLKKDLDIKEAMTIIVPTSPIPSHPSTEMIENTLRTIRHHTNMDIIITIDGVREEQKHIEPRYREYIKKLLWKCNFEYKNVIPVLFDEHVHQSGMMKEALKLVKTPLVMYVEHDTPLVTDEQIEWGLIVDKLLSGKANVVRFHYEAQIPKPHEHLMIPEKSIDKFIATRQWSQRPHVASTNFYRDVMQFFSDESNCFIEDRLYGQCVEAKWEDWKVFIYEPDKGNIKRSLNLDGRKDDRKFDKKGEQIW